MIFPLLLVGLLYMIFALVGILPEAHISEIWYIGPDVYDVLVAMAQTWAGVLDTVPYFEDAWNVVKYAIIPFELLMLVLKVILGSRTPFNNV